MRLAINIVLILASIAMIVLVLMQKGKSSGLGSAFGGGGENFFGKKKSAGREAKLSRYTAIVAAMIAVLSVAMVLIGRFA